MWLDAQRYGLAYQPIHTRLSILTTTQVGAGLQLQAVLDLGMASV